MMILCKRQEREWKDIKALLIHAQMQDMVADVDHDAITQKQLNDIQVFTQQEQFTVQKVMQISIAVGAFARWVLALERYAAAVLQGKAI